MILHDVQQGSDAWFSLRAGIVTASEFSKLITSTGAPSKTLQAYAYTKACEKYAGKPVDAFAGNVWTENGIADELKARESYSIFHTKDAVTEIGFVTDDDITCGCSPDGLVGDDGLLELKRMKGNLLVEAHLYYARNKKLLPKFVAQVQGQLMICKRQWCDVMIYNPLLPDLIIRVEPDEGFHKLLKQQICECNNLRDKVLADLGW